MISNSERARKTDDKIRTQILFNDKKKWDFEADILEALNEAVKETCEDMLRLLSSTDETVALHSEFTGKYRGI